MERSVPPWRMVSCLYALETVELMLLRRLINRLAVTRAMALMAVVGLGACAESAATAPGLGDRAGLHQQSVYRLGIGDKLKVTVFGETDLSGTYEINGQGHVAIPLVGEIPAKGETMIEFRDAVARKLSSGYLKNPKVSVEILTYRPIYVHGEVRTGGEFPFKNGMKLRDVIAVAGGYTYRANQKYVLLLRDGDPREQRVPMPTELIVQPGDNIRIPERFF